MALGKKVKTLLLVADVSVAAGVGEWRSAVASHTFQDDIRVIGAQVGVRPSVPDASVNADHQMAVVAEVSRHGVAEQDGAIARASWGGTWSAAIVVPSDGENPGAMVFPDGHGIDFDDGEVIYLHQYNLNIGTVTLGGSVWAIVYYVER